MRKKVLYLTIACMLLLLAGCGKKETELEAVDITNTDDIYAQQGEIKEVEIEDEVVNTTNVDTTALLKNALTGITGVRLKTSLQVAAIPTTLVDEGNTGGSSLSGLATSLANASKEDGVSTEENTEDVSEEEIENEVVDSDENVEEETETEERELTADETFVLNTLGTEADLVSIAESLDSNAYNKMLTKKHMDRYKENIDGIDLDDTRLTFDYADIIETNKEKGTVRVEPKGLLTNDTKINKIRLGDIFDEIESTNDITINRDITLDVLSMISLNELYFKKSTWVLTEEVVYLAKLCDNLGLKELTSASIDTVNETITLLNNRDIIVTINTKKGKYNFNDTDETEKDSAGIARILINSYSSTNANDVANSIGLNNLSGIDLTGVLEDDSALYTALSGGMAEEEDIQLVERTSYYVTMDITSDIDQVAAKHYGSYKMNLEKEVEEEVATYIDFSVEPAKAYIAKDSLVPLLDAQTLLPSDEPPYVLEKVWFEKPSEYYGLATFKKLMESAEVIGYSSSSEYHIINTNVDVELVKILDPTDEVISIVFAGQKKVPVTFYLTKADGILNKVIFTMQSFKGVLGKVNIQTSTFSITFDKYNSINKVMIPDTVMSSYKDISEYIEPSSKSFVTEEELNEDTNYDLADELAKDLVDIEEVEDDTKKEAKSEAKNEAETEEIDENTESKSTVTVDKLSKKKK